jgi:hypothetical protein
MARIYDFYSNLSIDLLKKLENNMKCYIKAIKFSKQVSNYHFLNLMISIESHYQ